MPEWRQRIDAVFATRGVSADLDVIEELAQHAAQEFDAACAAGQDAHAAAAHVERLIAEWCGDPVIAGRRSKRPSSPTPPANTRPLWTGLGRDVQYAFRLLGRHARFSTVVILTMGLGIAAVTTLLSVVYGVMLKPLPWPHADRLVRLSESRRGQAPRIKGTISNATFNAWFDDHQTLESLAGFLIEPTSALVGGHDATRLLTSAVTPSLFTVLDARPWRGRLFAEDDGRSGGSFPSKPVIILSYGLWQEWFGGRDDALGQTVTLAEKPYTVVGVMPPEFAFPTRETRAWTPWAVPSVVGPNGDLRMAIFGAIARLRQGATPEQAASEGTARARTAPDPGLAAVALFGSNGPADISAVPAIQMMTAEVRPALLVMLAAVLLLFLVATTNVINLQLGRAMARRRELAIRAAIGAGGTRLVRQLVIENTLLAAIGAAVGVGMAALLHRALPSLLPVDFPRAADVTLDRHVLFVVGALSASAGIACGVFPGLYARRLDLSQTLSADGYTSVGVSGRRALWARTLIIAVQLAVTCVLLIGGGLLARSFVSLLNADRGYDPRNLLTAQLSMPSSYSFERRIAMVESLIERLRHMPGVVDAAFGNALPLLSSGGFRALKMPLPDNPSVLGEVSTLQRVVSPGYFAALGLHLVSGRLLTDADNATSRPVVVVNRSFAKKYLRAQPLGAIVPNLGMCTASRDEWEVVGITDDMRQAGVLTDAPEPELFIPYRQTACANAMGSPVLVIRTSDHPEPMTPMLRHVVHAETSTLALDSVMTMEDRLMTTLAKPRLYAVVLGGFAAFALVLSSVGLFGVLSFIVTQRSREIGLRTALGARPADVMRLVLRQVSVASLIGITAGVWLAFMATSSLETVLYGVRIHDAVTFVVAPALLLLVAVLTATVPARRAARIDPLRVLRG